MLNPLTCKLDINGWQEITMLLYTDFCVYSVNTATIYRKSFGDMTLFEHLAEGSLAN